MLDVWKFPVLQKLLEILAAGEPPLYVRLLVINIFFVLVAIIRRARGAPKMRPAHEYAVKFLVLAANFLVLLQEQAIAGLQRLITIVSNAL